jgi:PAS domain S-box-containing protein
MEFAMNNNGLVLLLVAMAALGSLLVALSMRRIWPGPSNSESAHLQAARRRRFAVRAGWVFAGVYFVVGGLWICFSDQLVVLIVHEEHLISRAQTIKGLAFVTLTASLLGWLATRSLREVVTTQSKLRQSEEQFRSVFEYSATGMALVDLDGCFRAVNRAFCEMLDTPEQGLIGMCFTDFTHPDDRARCLSEIKLLVKGTKHPLQLEKRYRLKSGVIIWSLVTGSVVRDPEGKPLFLVAQVQDVTKRRQAEEALRGSEERLRATLENTPNVAVQWFDAEGRVLYWNHASETLYGWQASEVSGRTLDQLILDSEQEASFRASLKQIGETSQPVGPVEYPFHRRNGDKGISLTTIFQIPPVAGEPRFACMDVDITEQKRAEEARQDMSIRLLRSQDAERRRLARELHDTTAQGLAALALNLSQLQRLDLSKREEFDQILNESLALAERSGQEVRTLSYLLHPPELDLLGLPGTIREYAAGVNRRSGLQVEVEADPDFGRLPREMEIALFRIVQESLGNVLRHARSDMASIRLAREPNEITLQVSDRGRGISAEKLAELNQLQSGAGVGFTGMRERLNPFNGKLTVESGPDGTCVRASVPLMNLPA